MTTVPHTATASPQDPGSAEIVARAGSYYRNTRFILAAALVAMGLWFGYDGFIGWPRENELYKQDPTRHKQHSETDIRLQKILAFTLPPLGLLMLVWTLYNSRGAYRLSGDTLSVPGHPPVPLDSIRQIDKRLWDRKGIAYLDYELAEGRKGRIKLDDFVYDRPPTDAIVDRIEATLLPPTAEGVEAGEAVATEGGIAETEEDTRV